MEKINYGKKSIRVFFVLVIVLSAIMDVLYCKYEFTPGVALLMWMPAVAAIIAAVYSFRENGEKYSFKALNAKAGFRRSKFKYILAGVLIPLVYLLIPYMLYWKMHPENFAYSGVALGLILKDCLPMAILGTVVSMLTATGEEIGWRGFLVPALNNQFGIKKTFLITGLFWCLWHFPLLIWGGYMEGPSLLYSLIAFLFCIFPVAIICGLLALESGSMWPCAVLHAAHNNYDQAILGVITRGEDKMFYVSETGIFTILCAWAIAIVMYVRFRKKQLGAEKDKSEIQMQEGL